MLLDLCRRRQCAGCGIGHPRGDGVAGLGADVQPQLGAAPKDVVEQVKAKHAGLEEKQKKLESNLNRLKEMGS